MNISRVQFHCATMGMPIIFFPFNFIMSKHTYNFFQTSLVRSRIAERCRIFLTAGKHIFPPYQENFIFFLFIYLFVCLFIYLFFRAAPMAYGGSQARGWLRAAAAAYATGTAMPDPSHICHLHYSSQQRQILNPLSKARDRNRNLIVLSRIH